VGMEIGENELSNLVINRSIKVHKRLGPGLLESVYRECLYYELSKAGIKAEKEKPLPLIYEQVRIEVGYRVDLLVENKVIIEIKAVHELSNIHLAQLLTYLRLANCRLGIVINFNVLLLKDGIRRVANRL
jgi:GxxExxY protein